MQLLFNPQRLDRYYPDQASKDFIARTVEFFEQAGHGKLRDNYHAKRWYSDFLQHVKQYNIFATSLTPAGYGAGDARWDTWRNCELAEVLGFYGLEYWYTWQVSMLGVGPIWISKNEPLKNKTAQLLRDGAVFAFGLSEKHHGADIYASEMELTPQADGSYRANGGKYYIGNGNKAALVSVFGKMKETGEYVFFAVSSSHSSYECVQQVTVSQSYVAEFHLRDYPVSPEDIIARGSDAWDAALNTVNFCKYNLGWASIGICTHAFYEAIAHASNRRLYKMFVTDFPHVRQLFVDAYTRLTAMKLFTLRAADYMRSASPQDRRYLLFNPLVKMKVTTEGEQVMNELWDVIAARGFEKDLYFQEATSAIRGLPKLEGTVHVNIALIVKFMNRYFFNPQPYTEIPRRDDAANDVFLFQQGSTKGLADIGFPDFKEAYQSWSLPCVQLFYQQVQNFRSLLQQAPPLEPQRTDTGWLLALGDIFALAVYAQLILENAKIYQSSHEVVDQIFDFMVRDMSVLAVELHGKAGTTPQQAALCLRLVERPPEQPARFAHVWEKEVLPYKQAYKPRP